MNDFDLLRVRSIIDILIGDTVLYEKDGFQAHLPYLTGPAICDLSTQFGYPIAYALGGGARSRWEYMDALLDYVIKNNDVSRLFAWMMSYDKFSYLGKFVEQDKLRSTYEAIISTAIEKINAVFAFSKKELRVHNNDFIITSIGAGPIIHTPVISRVDEPYIRGLKERCNQDFFAGNYDSVITKSRTLIEEVLVQILDECQIPIQSKGDLNKINNQVKNLLNMQQSGAHDKRVNKLLSNLEQIVLTIGEMRNASSDAHGVGQARISIRECEAQLVLNSAMSYAEYVFAVYSEKSKNKTLIQPQ